MFDINEFNERLLREYEIIEGNNRMKLFNYLVGEFTNEIEEVSYANLKKTLESDTVSLQEKNKIIRLKKVSKIESTIYKLELYVDLYYSEQSNNVLSKRAILRDYKYEVNGILYIKEIKILELDADGSVTYIKIIDRNNREGIEINVKYYNPETVEHIGPEHENIEIYDLLDKCSIHCDKEAKDMVNSYAFENYLISIEKCKDALKDDMSMRKEK